MPVLVPRQGRVFFAAPKAIAETPVLSVDFAPSLVVTGEGIADVDVQIFDRADPGTDLTTAMSFGAPTFSGTVVSQTVKAGDDGHDYVCRFIVTTNKDGGRTERAQVIFPVRDRPYEAYGAQILSVEEVMDDLAVAETDYLKIEALVNEVSQRIERFCHTIFRKQSFTLTGPNGALKFTGPTYPLLDLGAPILSVASVMIGTTLLDPTTYVVMPDRGQLYRIGGWLLYSPLADAGPWAPWFSGLGPFKPLNVTVEATLGWDPIPADVVGRCQSLIRYYWAQRGREGLWEERIGEYLYRKEQSNKIDEAGIPAEIAAGLEPYIRWPT